MECTRNSRYLIDVKFYLQFLFILLVLLIDRRYLTQAFESDINLMVANAKKYNMTESDIYHDAMLIHVAYIYIKRQLFGDGLQPQKDEVAISPSVDLAVCSFFAHFRDRKILCWRRMNVYVKYLLLRAHSFLCYSTCAHELHARTQALIVNYTNLYTQEIESAPRTEKAS